MAFVAVRGTWEQLVHITRVEIKNLRSIERLTWAVDPDKAAGWHVVLGNNGSGKTTFLRAIALALAGSEGAWALRQSPEAWAPRGHGFGTATVKRVRHDGFDESARGHRPSDGKVDAQGSRSEATPDVASLSIGIDYSNGPEGTGSYPNPFVHGEGHATGLGWFCAGFGPFRRFTGGEAEPEGLQSLGRYLSLFDERYAFTSSLQWLSDLHHASLALAAPEQEGAGSRPKGPQKYSRDAYGRVRAFLNQPGFLPNGVTMESVTPPRHVAFRDGAGASVAIEELSDGFRSALSLIIELLRQLLAAFGLERVLPATATSIDVPGVVLIDEVDVHLHPTWQRNIGEFLTRAFPRMQFIVTTHSPLVCRAAEHGSIYLLPEAGGVGEARFVTDLEKRRLVLGNVLDALSTGAFGPVSQSEVGAERRKRLAELNAKEITLGLSSTESDERNALRAELPSRSATLTSSG